LRNLECSYCVSFPNAAPSVVQQQVFCHGTAQAAWGGDQVLQVPVAHEYPASADSNVVEPPGTDSRKDHGGEGEASEYSSPTGFSKYQVVWQRITAGVGYTFHTAVLSLLVFVAALPLEVPLAKLAFEAFLHIEQIMGDGYGVYHQSQTQSFDGLWSVTSFKLLHHTISAIPYPFSRWAILCFAWHGWDKSKGFPLLVATVATLIFISSSGGLVFALHYGIVSSLTKNCVTLAIVIPSNFIAVVLMVKRSSTMTWWETFKLVSWSTPLECMGTFFLVLMFQIYFQLHSSLARVLVRVLVPICVRRLWIHFSFHLSLRFDVTHEKHRFMIMLFPVAASAAAGTCLQLGASLPEAASMSVCMLALEVTDAMALLSGSTQIEQCLRILKWCWQKSTVQFTNIEPVIEPVNELTLQYSENTMRRNSIEMGERR